MNIIKLQGNKEKRNKIYYEYDIDSKPLGEGGMGRVFKGFKVMENTGEKIPVAIKAIYDNIPERVVERARREAEIQLENDNLIKMYGFVETLYFDSNGKNKIHYHVIMELLIGVTLEDIINGITSDSNGLQIPFAIKLHTQYVQDREKTVIYIMKAILLGLMALHDKGYIHRDIDPSNIMVTIDGKIKLIDFGICKQIISLESVDKALTSTGVFMGKVNYAAPELVIGDVKSQNYTTDIYAMGILLYQLYTGHLPFNGTDQDILASNLRTPLPLKDIKRREFRRIISKATDKNQTKRYSSATEFRVDLERICLNEHSKSKNHLKVIMTFIVIIAILSFLFIYVKKESVQKKEELSIQPTCEEIYLEAKKLLCRKDCTQLYNLGKEKLSSLVNDSLYEPAKLDYYTLKINNIGDPKDVSEGFHGLQNLCKDSTNFNSLYECGLTLSKYNMFLDDLTPELRQRALGIKPDLQKANMFLYKAASVDRKDYKSIYWILNNLIEMKMCNSCNQKQIDIELVSAYKEFNKRINMHDDDESKRYLNAFCSDKKTLESWGII